MIPGYIELTLNNEMIWGRSTEDNFVPTGIITIDVTEISAVIDRRLHTNGDDDIRLIYTKDSNIYRVNEPHGEIIGRMQKAFEELRTWS